MKALFFFAILLNSFLIFWVELLTAKRLLPALGGSPSVWNTSLTFYQIALLAGYGYTLLLDRLTPKRQYTIHAGLLLVVVCTLPWTLFLWDTPSGEMPVLWLLALLALSLGLPFFVLSAGAPLLQRWFSQTGHREANDPYFLYAASNLGSFLALAAYPLLLEPLLTLDRQTVLWKASYVGVGGLVLLSGAVMLRRVAGGEAKNDSPVPNSGAALAQAPEPVAPAQRWRWVLLAFVPSSLLLGVTTHITSEIAPVPLLWVVPLGLYLLTFIVAFGTKLGGTIAVREAVPGRAAIVPVVGGAMGMGEARVEQGRMGDAMAIGGDRESTGGTLSGMGGAIAGGEEDALLRGRLHGRGLRWGGSALLLLLVGALLWSLRGQAGWLLLLGDLMILAAAGLLCHSRLARDRPHPQRLAEFYLWLAVGGAIGGVFNTLIAPLIFQDPLEYPLVLALFAFLASSRGGNAPPFRWSDLLLGALPGAVALLFVMIAPRWGLEPRALLPLAGVVCLAIAGRPVRFGLGVAGLVLIGFTLPSQSGQVVFRERTFYGIHRIYQDDEHYWLAHGTTVHGGESTRSPGVPLTYYHPQGPAGTLFHAFHGGAEGLGSRHIAAIGLGTGSLMAYARDGESWGLYELDPTVAKIAENPAYFTFLSDTSAEYEIVLGDARLSMEGRENSYDLIVVDAFSSDAIPVHLLTREAIDLYRSRLRPGGWIAFHTSNRYADFSLVLSTLATEAGLSAFEGVDEFGDLPAGRYPSRWVLFAEQATGPRIDLLRADPRWQPLPAREGRVWTDGYSSLLEVLRPDRPR